MNKKTYCGADCSECPSVDSCAGCVATSGRPFGVACPIAVCCLDGGFDECDSCKGGFCKLKQPAIDEFNAMVIKDMGTITDLNALSGAYINVEYPLPNGKTVKFLDDDKIYLGNQIEKPDGRCYGVVADEKFLLVCEYGENGADPEIVLYKKR